MGILKYPNPLLAAKSAPVESIDIRIRAIAHRMLSTMLMAPGYGLAASQVGVLKRMLAVDPGRIIGEPEPGPMVMLNPVVLETGGGALDEEGCLSLPGIYALVGRPTWMVLEYTNLVGKRLTMEADGYLARCLLHEVDHLDGILFWDRLPRSQRTVMKMKYFTRLEWVR
ncbi:MAG: peptide deformylase [Nitrospinota bacterium]|nr:peptide deformylase [Nitrospinota bacterium]